MQCLKIVFELLAVVFVRNTPQTRRAVSFQSPIGFFEKINIPVVAQGCKYPVRIAFRLRCTSRSFVDIICDFCVSLIFPPDKTLCPASPSLLGVPWVSVPHLLDLPTYRPSVLRSAKTTVSPSQVASLSARFPLPCLLPLTFVSLSAHGVRRMHLVPCQARFYTDLP